MTSTPTTIADMAALDRWKRQAAAQHSDLIAAIVGRMGKEGAPSPLCLYVADRLAEVGPGDMLSVKHPPELHPAMLEVHAFFSARIVELMNRLALAHAETWMARQAQGGESGASTARGLSH